MSDPRVLTQPLSGSPLAYAAATGGVSAAWYRPRPTTIAEWRTHAEAIRAEFAASDWLDRVWPAIEPSVEAAARLARVDRGQGIIVTTGQQPGLFGGPMYTWYKALSALAFANTLQAVIGLPVAPVFWAATDDSDFAEAAATHIAVVGGLETLTLPPPKELGMSMQDTPLGNVSDLLLALGRGAGSTAYPDVLEVVREAYSGGETVGGAYVTLLRRILQPLGIAVLDAGHPAVRRAGMPVLTAALREARAIEEAVRERERVIGAAGYEPKVSVVVGLSLVFETTDGRRSRVPIPAAETRADRAVAGSLGPNVLLRPVVERSLLPTVAYLGGPSEIAYFAQVSAVADALRRPAPLIMPRWSGLIIEPHIERLLERHGLAMDELRDPHAAESRLARRALPEPIAAALARFRERVTESTEDLARAQKLPSTLVPDTVIDGARRAVEQRIDRLERRVLAAVKRQHVDAMRDVATARAALFPMGTAQERVLNLIPLLARHGPPLVHAILYRATEHARSLVTTTGGLSDGVGSLLGEAPLSESPASQ